MAKGAFSATSPRSQNSEDPLSGAHRSTGLASTILPNGHTPPSPHNPTSPTSPTSEAHVTLAATLEAAPLPGIAHAPQPLYAHHAAAATVCAVSHNGPYGGISSQAGTFRNHPAHGLLPPAHIPRDAAAVRKARIASVDAAVGAETLSSLTDGVEDSTVICAEAVVVSPLTFGPDLSRARSLAREAAAEEAEDIEYLEFGSNGGGKGQRQQKKEKQQQKPLSRQDGGQYGRSSSSPLPRTAADGGDGSVLKRLLRRAVGAFGSLRSSPSSGAECSGSGGGGGGQARSGGSRLGLGQQSSRSMRLRARVEADDDEDDGDEPVQVVRALNSIVVHKRRQRLGMDTGRGSARARCAAGLRAGAQLGKGAAAADQGAPWLRPLVSEEAEAAFTALMLGAGEGLGTTIPAGRMSADGEEDGGRVTWRVQPGAGNDWGPVPGSIG